MSTETIWTIEGNIGYTFAADLTWGILDITPYTGVGYRHWTRGQADAETGNYEEVYNSGIPPGRSKYNL
ncbi:hypothetical protein BLFGPEAP_01151 [Candidatus Methanoperedenaceae archaeon GB50]|nr:hypothetical protein BLFGPEAP_01151 [Candidatus Methanoperedenaceae archaeon GB50]